MAIQIYDPPPKSRTGTWPSSPSGEPGRSANRPRRQHEAQLRRALLRIAALLERDHGAKAHIIRKKKSSGAAPHAEIIEEYKASCDVVVAGVGD